jgi:hypothetical protein
MPRRNSPSDNARLRRRTAGGIDAAKLMKTLRNDSRLDRNRANAKAGRWRESS